MKIASADLQLASQHASHSHHSVRESLRAWVGERPPAGTQVSLSPQARSAQEADATDPTDAERALESDERHLILKRMVELLTGREIEVVRSEDLQATSTATPASGRPAAGFGVEYTRHEIRHESEFTRFAAAGVVTTDDGREIRFQLDFAMQRSFTEETRVSLRAGDAVMKDPLVIHFDTSAAQLSSERFAFDLDADGTQEQIAFVGRGSGFLVLDRNGDGVANDGSELFGPRSGKGFAELARHDQDGNGWIDAADVVFKDLRIWTRDADGRDRLAPLADYGIGAVGLAHVATPFSLKTDANALLGQVRSSGVYLTEAGGAGVIQQIDLAV